MYAGCAATWSHTLCNGIVVIGSVRNLPASHASSERRLSMTRTSTPACKSQAQRCCHKLRMQGSECMKTAATCIFTNQRHSQPEHFAFFPSPSEFRDLLRDRLSRRATGCPALFGPLCDSLSSLFPLHVPMSNTHGIANFILQHSSVIPSNTR